MNKLLVMTCLILGIMACAKEKNNEPNTPIPPDNKGFVPSSDSLKWVYGLNEFNLEVNGVVRNFVVHVPNSYQHKNDSVPLLFMLHGSSGTGIQFYNISSWVEKADQEGFIAIFPTGYEYPIKDKNGELSTKWNDAGTINDVEPGTVLQNDVAFMQWLVEKAQKTFNIDHSRRYITGFSNGGGFVRDRVVQEIPELFAAAATGGGFGIPEPKAVNGGRRMPLFCILGTKDDRILEAGGLTGSIPFKGTDFMAIASFRVYLDAMLATLQLDTIYAENQNPPGYNILTFNTRLGTQKNEYKLMLVNKLEHKFPNGKNNPHDVSAPDILWPWFKQWQH